jgi:hypothetical protein
MQCISDCQRSIGNQLSATYKYVETVALRSFRRHMTDIHSEPDGLTIYDPML